MCNFVVVLAVRAYKYSYKNNWIRGRTSKNWKVESGTGSKQDFTVSITKLGKHT
ncbi:hypothetical protein FRX31_009868, partial [Thalictrum thalictroides]